MWLLLSGAWCWLPKAAGHNAASPHGERCNAALLLLLLLLGCAHPRSLFVSAPCGVEELNHGSAVHCGDTTRLDFQM